jgi:hypothetical protein
MQIKIIMLNNTNKKNNLQHDVLLCVKFLFMHTQNPDKICSFELPNL